MARKRSEPEPAETEVTDETIDAASDSDADLLDAIREESGTALAVRGPAELTVDELVERRGKIEQAMSRAMKSDVHYGVIPGTKKPTLLKPGAELLNSLFGLAASYPAELRRLTWHEDGHMTAELTCVLRHMASGTIVGDGVGLCSTMEAKYAWRQGTRTCPECGAEAIKKGRTRDKKKAQFYCYRKIDGCGASWDEGTEPYEALEAQDTSRVANPDLPDAYNTVLKIAAKRALVAAVLNATAASDVFTQDLEDGPRAEGDTPFDSGSGPYDAAGEPPDPYRQQDGGTGLPVPTTFTAWLDRFAKLRGGGDDAKDEAVEWLRELVEKVYGVDSIGAMQRSDHPKALQRLAGVVLDLEAQPGDHAFTTGWRDTVARAFAAKFDGQALHGPPWRLGPDEEKVTYEEWVKGRDAAAAPVEGEDPSIEFGKAPAAVKP